jgi:chromosome partitioning protein
MNPGAKIRAVANQKGGVGKTTTAINLGTSLAMAEQRVLLVDLDPQANLTSGVGLKGQAAPAGTIYQALTSDVDDVSQFVLKTAIQNLSLIPADRNLTGAEIDLVTLAQREHRLRTCLDRLRAEFDYILVDTPPSLGLLTVNAFVAATGVIVPVQTEYLSLRGLVQLENTLAMVRENLNPRVEIVGIVPTMYDRRVTHSREADEILRENFGDLVYNTRIKKTVRFAEAPVKGSSVIAYEPTGEAAMMYRDLAKEVLSGEKSRQHA